MTQHEELSLIHTITRNTVMNAITAAHNPFKPVPVTSGQRQYLSTGTQDGWFVPSHPGELALSVSCTLISELSGCQPSPTGCAVQPRDTLNAIIWLAEKHNRHIWLVYILTGVIWLVRAFVPRGETAVRTFSSRLGAWDPLPVTWHRSTNLVRVPS